jgi:8-oxo-dGTP pyrophosphatase MutT (NUDIX family)
MSPKRNGGAAIVCTIICPSANIGLFIRQPDKEDPMWKMASGEVEPGESIPAALLRETEEETGFKIPSVRDATGALVVGNDEYRCVSFGSEEVIGRGGAKHTKHWFAVIVADARELIALDGQRRKEDDEETIETKVFSLDRIVQIPDFLPKQRTFLNNVLQRFKNTENA